MALYLDIAVGDRLFVGDDTVVTLVRKSGRHARLRIDGFAEVELVKGKGQAPVLEPDPVQELDYGQDY